METFCGLIDSKLSQQHFDQGHLLKFSKRGNCLNQMS